MSESAAASVDESVVVEESIEDRIFNDFVSKTNNESTITMYRFANILSELVSTRVREQMMYNYKSKHLITNATFVDNKLVVASAREFVVKFVSKRISK